MGSASASFWEEKPDSWDASGQSVHGLPGALPTKGELVLHHFFQGRPGQVRPMSLNRLFQRVMRRCLPAPTLALIAFGVVALTGCADQSVDADGTYAAFLSMGAVFPEQTSHQLSLVNAWRVQVQRPGEGVIAEDGGSVTPDQQTVTVQLSVQLEAACEMLTILIELSSNGEVWFRSEEVEEICVGSDNGLQGQEMHWVGPVLGLSSPGLSFTLQEGGAPLSQSLIVTNQGGGTLNWSASDDQAWLGLLPNSGSLGAGQSETVSVTVSDLDLTGGQYQGLITVSDPNAVNSPGSVSVTLTYIQLPRIGLSGLDFSFTTDELLDPNPQTLTVTNTGGGVLNWTAHEDVEWLDVAPGAGSLGPGQSHDLVVSVSPGDLPGGTYRGTFTILDPNAANSPMSVAVAMTVLPRPVFGLSLGGLSFTTFNPLDPPSQVLTISNEGGQTLNWTASIQGGDWLGLSTQAGSLAAGQSQNLTVSVNTENLGVGEYQASITFTDPFALNSPQTAPVTLDVQPGPLIGLSSTQVNFGTLFGGTVFPQGLTVSNAGGGVLEWQAYADALWVQLLPTSGSLGTVGGVGLGQTLTIGIETAGLPVGTHDAIITVSDPDAANSPRTIGVRVTVFPRVAPVIDTLTVNLTTLNDPTCQNPQGAGSRFRATFHYWDTNGDLPIAGGSFLGTPLRVVSSFPEGPQSASQTTAEVEGDSYSGKAGFDLCIYFYEHGGANIWITLADEWNLSSNQLYYYIQRPEGANSPAQPGGSRVPAEESGPGSVVISVGGSEPEIGGG